MFGGLNMDTGEYVAIKRIKRTEMNCDDMVTAIKMYIWTKYLSIKYITEWSRSLETFKSWAYCSL